MVVGALADVHQRGGGWWLTWVAHIRRPNFKLEAWEESWAHQELNGANDEVGEGLTAARVCVELVGRRG